MAVSESLLLRVAGEASAARRMLTTLQQDVQRSSAGISRIAGLTAANTALAFGRAAAEVARFAGNMAAAVVGPVADFDAGMANVNTLLVGETRKSLGVLKKELMDLPPVLGSAKDLTDGLYQAISAGVEPAKSVEFVGVALKAAQAGLADGQTAVDALTSAMNAYGDASLDVNEVSDLFFETVRRGKTTFPELAAGIGQVASIAASAKVPQQEMMAVMAELTKVMPTPIAFTSFRSALSSIIKPTQEATDYAEELSKKLGKDLKFNAAALEAKGFVGLLKELRDATGGNVEAMAKFFPNVRALPGVLKLLDGDLQGVNASLDAMAVAASKSVDVTGQAFDDQQQSFNAMRKRIGNELERIAIRAGDVLLPHMKASAQFVLDNMGTIEKFATSSMQAISNVISNVAPVMRSGVKALIDEYEAGFPTISGHLNAFRETFDLTVFTAKQMFAEFKSNNHEVFKAAGDFVDAAVNVARNYDTIISTFMERNPELVSQVEHFAALFRENMGQQLDERMQALVDFGQAAMKTGRELATFGGEVLTVWSGWATELNKALGMDQLTGAQQLEVWLKTILNTSREVSRISIVALETTGSTAAGLVKATKTGIEEISKFLGTLSVEVEQFAQRAADAFNKTFNGDNVSSAAKGFLSKAWELGTNVLPGGALVKGATTRATGGPLGAGRLSLVGERGPEMFVPSSSGQIIPNDKLGELFQALLGMQYAGGFAGGTNPGGVATMLPGPVAPDLLPGGLGVGVEGPTFTPSDLSGSLDQLDPTLAAPILSAAKIAKELIGNAAAEGAGGGTASGIIDGAEEGTEKDPRALRQQAWDASVKGATSGLVDGFLSGDVGGAIKGFAASMGQAVMEQLKMSIMQSLGSQIIKAMGLPGFADGGFTPGGPVLVGEEGPEILRPPAGSRVYPHDESMRMLGGTNITIENATFQFGGTNGGAQTMEQLARSLVPYISKVVDGGQAQLRATSTRNLGRRS